jgi:hypothetical protein
MKKIIEGKHIIVFASIVVVMLLGLVSMICYFYTDKLYHILFLFILIISIISSQKNNKGDTINFFNS